MKPDIILTNHAKDRLKEYGISVEKAKGLFKTARRCVNTPGRKIGKLRTYGIRAMDTLYFYQAPLYFVIVQKPEGMVCVTIHKRKKKGLRFRN